MLCAWGRPRDSRRAPTGDIVLPVGRPCDSRADRNAYAVAQHAVLPTDGTTNPFPPSFLYA
jgi:hypothetical protein